MHVVPTAVMVRATRCSVVVLLACATFLTTGCGSGSSLQAQKTAEFVALANKFCSEISTHRAESPAHRVADAAKLRIVEREDRNLPSLRQLRADERKLREAIEHAKETELSKVVSERRGRVLADLRNLGMTECLHD
jgi:hypothetical protein